MASNLTVKVHPVVYMSMVDAYERRIRKKNSNDKALGTLLGFYEKNVVQITNCYSIPFREIGENQELDDIFNKQMWNFSRRATPSEQIVGWFITVRDVSERCQIYHNYYTALVNEIAVKKELPPIVLLTLDVSFEGQAGRLPVNAYTRCDAGVAGQAAIFHPLKVEMDAFPGESVALSVIQKGIYNERREIPLEEDSDLRNLHSTADDIVQWLERALDYVEEVLLKESPTAEDTAFGRKLMNIVNIAATQLQPDKLDGLVKASIRDFMMVSYLSQLIKTQLSVQEKLLTN